MSKIRHRPKARFISLLVKREVSTCLLTNRLIGLADDAYASRDKQKLALIGARISEMSVSEGVGEYYSALALSQADRARADKVLMSVAESSSPLYRARALLALGSHRQSDGDIIAALEHYQDAERLGGSDNLVRLYTGENRAIIESARGNHKAALRGFVGVHRYAQGANLFNNLNSIAEELKNLGRHTEAAHYSRLCLSSPFAKAYPEWSATATEIHSTTHSSVYVSALWPVKISARVSSNPTRALMDGDNVFDFKKRQKPPHGEFQLSAQRALYDATLSTGPLTKEHWETLHAIYTKFTERLPDKTVLDNVLQAVDDALNQGERE